MEEITRYFLTRSSEIGCPLSISAMRSVRARSAHNLLAIMSTREDYERFAEVFRSKRQRQSSPAK